ncbi:hypothetical protein [Corynebacterium liangguodongii]|uniref:Uncharacterized protein n=1 Tax=Corynebacterium liangguodongii TaxID=2079535 RepID=A0A2S0WBX9_9CORY|nr:hypothetical protein [Corynebacterium liangguodongii]AWB83268.1 hypothetical protein C3E79_01190 [Corynebacterium liangguodongii]PWC00642.1 hypothetical protein DF219_01760 [Corynebacterium liangguodongii]
MDDIEWLATRRGRLALRGSAVDGLPGSAGVVVEPTRVAAAARLGVPVIAVVGLPDGRHHSVIKAAEARLAVEMGADEIWLAIDADAAGENAVLADAIAVRQAVEAPARLGLIHAGRPEVVRAGELLGADVLVCEAGHELPRTSLELALWGLGEGIDAAVDALAAGASRVFSGTGLIPPARRG